MEASWLVLVQLLLVLYRHLMILMVNLAGRWSYLSTSQKVLANHSKGQFNPKKFQLIGVYYTASLLTCFLKNIADFPGTGGENYQDKRRPAGGQSILYICAFPSSWRKGKICWKHFHFSCVINNMQIIRRTKLKGYICFMINIQDYGMLEEKVKSVLQNYEDFRLTRGRKVITWAFNCINTYAIISIWIGLTKTWASLMQVMEIRPSIEWNKGHALEYFLDSLGFSNSNDVLPLYIGDDRTDEDAFTVS